MPARVAAKIELENVNAFLSSTKEAEKAFSLLGGAAIAAAAIVTAAMAGVVTAVGTLGTVAIKSAATFEQQMKRVQAVGGTNAAQTAALGKDVLKLSQSYNYTADQISDASGEIIKSGVAAKYASGPVLAAAMDLATLTKGEISAGKAATFLAGSMTAWGIGEKDVERITNALTTASNASAVSVNDLMRSLQQVTAVADFAGFTIEDVTAALAIMGQEYMKNSDAGTSLKQMMMKLMAPTAKAKELLNQYGVNLNDANGNALDFVDVVAQLDTAFGDQAFITGKITKAQQEYALATIFGSDALRAAAVVAMSGVSGYKAMQNQMLDSDRSAKQMAATINSGLIPRFNMLHNIVTSFGTAFGGPFVGAISEAINKLNDRLRSIDLGAFEQLGKYFVDLAKNGQASADAIWFAFGPNVAKVVESLGKLLLSLRDTFERDLMPAFANLKAAILGEKSSTQTLGDAFTTLADLSTKAGQGFAGIINGMAYIIREAPKVVASINSISAAVKGNENLMRALELAATVALAALAVSTILKTVAGFLELASVVVKFVATLGGLTTAVSGVTKAWGLFATAGRAALLGLAPIAAALGVSVGGLILIIAAIVAALATLYIFWPQISAAIAQFGNTVSSIFQNSVIPWLVEAWAKIQAAAAPVIAWLEQAWLSILPVIQTVANIIGVVLVASIAVAVLAVAGVVLAIYKLGEIVVRIVSNFVQGTITIAKSLSGTLAPAIDFISDHTSKWFNRVWSDVTSVFNYVADHISAIANKIGSDWNWLWTNLAKITGQILKWMLERFIAFVGAIESISPIFKGMSAAAVGAVNDIMVSFDAAMKEIPGLAQDAADAASNAWAGAKDSIIRSIGGAVTTGIQQFNQLGDSAVDNANRAIEAWAAANAAAASGHELEDEKKFMKEAGGPKAPRSYGPSPRANVGVGTYPASGGGGGDDADKWTKFFATALKSLPLMNKQLAEFLGGLAKEAPERAQPMVDSLLKQTNLIKAMAVEKAKLIVIDMAILKIDQNIAGATAELNKVNLQIKAVELKYAAQILGLQNQLLNVQMRIAQVQQELNTLMQDNVALARQRIILEQEIFPIKQRIAKIDREIEKLNRVNRQIELEKAKMYLEALPALQQQAQLEDKIANVGNKRIALLQEEQQLQLKLSDTILNRQQRINNKSLESAWATNDVAKILQLEKVRESLDTQQADITDKASEIQEEIDLRTLNEDITKNALEQEKVGVDEIVAAYQTKLLALQQTQDMEVARAAVRQAELELEKQQLQDLIQPIEDQIFAIGQEIDLEKSRNALRIFDLQQELIALQNLATQIQLNIQQLQLQMANETLQYQQRAIQLEQYINEESIKRAELESTRLQQEAVFMELIAEFLASMEQSGAFTEAEAGEVAKRLGLWDDSISKLFDLKQAYDTIVQATKDSNSALDAYTQSLINMPKYYEIEIKTIYTSEDRRAGGGPVVANNPYIVGEKGQELFVPKTDGMIIPADITARIINDARPTQTLAGSSKSVTNNNTTTTQITYAVEAHYSQIQSPASIATDLKALQMMVKR